MGAVLITLVALLASADPPAKADTPRKPHPLFPSLHELSEEEESQLDQIIDRFIDYDSGKLRGVDGKPIVKEFQALTADAIPALIRGINKAAKIEHSCPAVTIRNKLRRMLNASRDVELLEFARENIAAGITESRHLGMLRDLRVQCMLRKRQIEQNAVLAQRGGGLKGDGVSSSEKEPRTLRNQSISELVEAAGTERGSKLKAVLTELGRRRGDQVIGALGAAAATYDGDIQKLARELLTRQLSSLKTDSLKEKLKDDRSEVRATAARLAGSKSLHWEKELIELLTDDESEVRLAAHQTLVKLTKGLDFGPKDTASEPDRHTAARKWRDWLKQQGAR